MFGSTILDVAVGLIFTYFLLSMIASHINEAIASIFNLRANSLEESIRNLLSDPQLVDKVWNHSLVQGLSGKAGKAPAYIPSNMFALAVFDALVPPSGKPTALDDLYTAAQGLPESPARQSILSILQHADGDVDKARAGVENWFNSVMDRLTGKYKRLIQKITLFVALTATVIIGVDTLDLAQDLWHEQEVRAAFTATAQTQPASLPQLMNTIGQFSLGWGKLPQDVGGWLLKIVGLAITTLAVSLGAPFWFDVLKNLANMRNAGPAPQPSESSKKA
jgi:hypothetical protein